MPDGQHLLLLTHRWPYPPDKGDRIRAFGLLRELSRHFPCDLLSLSDAFVPQELVTPLQPMVQRCQWVPRPRSAKFRGLAKSLLTGRSVTEEAFRQRRFSHTLSEWLSSGRYTAVVAICSSVAAAMLRHREVPLVVDFVDADSAKWAEYAEQQNPAARQIYRREANRVARLEEALVRRAALTVAVSPLELELLAASIPGPRLAVPNGVDVEFFAPPEHPVPRKHVVFVGQMDYWPNVQAVQWFVQKVWPVLHRQNPRAEFRIVGRSPTAEVLALAAMPGVHVTGEVPDVRPFIHDAVVVAPLQIARGIQNKILEALACGAPVAASPKAVQGIDLSDWQALRVCDEPAQWVSAVDYLLRRGEQADALSAQARRFILSRYTWPMAVAPLVEAIRAFAPASKACLTR